MLTRIYCSCVDCGALIIVSDGTVVCYYSCAFSSFAWPTFSFYHINVTNEVRIVIVDQLCRLKRYTYLFGLLFVVGLDNFCAAATSSMLLLKLY